MFHREKVVSLCLNWKKTHECHIESYEADG